MDIVTELQTAFYEAKRNAIQNGKEIKELHLSRDFWNELKVAPDFYKVSQEYDQTQRVFGFIPIVHYESDEWFWFTS